MQNVETALNDNVLLIDEKVAIANKDITSYINTLGEKAREFEIISNDSDHRLRHYPASRTSHMRFRSPSSYGCC